jgi:hypothetical protein
MKPPYKFEKEGRGKRRREEKEEQESPPGLNPASAIYHVYGFEMISLWL